MKDLTKDDLEFLDRIGAWTHIGLRKKILKNQELRKEIVDLADIWDGEESLRYGKSLQRILDKLGINDVPDFYKKENIDKLIREINEGRK